MNESLIRPWVNKLNPYEQSILMSTLRGCDNEDNSLKRITKMFRYMISNDLNSKTKYTTDYVLPINEVASILAATDQIHWRDHIMKAISVIINSHPHNYVRYYWTEVNSILYHQGIGRCQ